MGIQNYQKGGRWRRFALRLRWMVYTKYYVIQQRDEKMFKQTMKNDEVGIHQDVSVLADTLDDLLKSYGGKAQDDIDAARNKAETLLKETRVKMHNRNRVTEAARDAGRQVDNWIHDKPWHGAGVSAAVGIFIGALLASRR